VKGFDVDESWVAAHIAKIKGGSDASEKKPMVPCPYRPFPIIPDNHMNKTERKFADNCEIQKYIKKIIDYRYEPCRLILSPNVKGGRNAVSYLPDFLVIYATHFEFVEVKAKSGKWSSMRDDARSKINIAASMFPWFQFTVAYLEKGEWSFERL
jgi:hypothetical protein